MSEAISVEKLVAAYRKLRAAISDEEKAHEERLAPLKDKLELVSAELLEFCNDQNVDSVRTNEIGRAHVCPVTSLSRMPSSA